MFTSTPLPIVLVRQLEIQYKSNYATANKDLNLPILVLGGGHVNDATLPSFGQLNESALARLVQGVMLYRQNPGRKLVCSGYSHSGRTPNATVMASTAVGLGVNPKDTLQLVKPSSTWEEADAFKMRFGSKTRFFLVTSAIHMPRAMETFRKAGLHPLAVPTSFMVKKDPDKTIYTWRPSWSKMQLSERALHEYFGMWYYRLFKA
ncbi:YdcF family protein [Flavobacterium magnum]|uniref:YdcF family protein n=1 Tax=Flavobacterium magnum TaxID=2162713 RepID=UPI0015E771CC|nr:YdcF family protein [Flavobacterium magnum]